MKLGIILQSSKPEHIWNAFRLGITVLQEVFLMNEGVELDTIPDNRDFDISAKVAQFKNLDGTISVCGSCLKIRGKEESGNYPVATMSDLLRLIETSEKVLVLG